MVDVKVRIQIQLLPILLVQIGSAIYAQDKSVLKWVNIKRVSRTFKGLILILM